MSDPTIGRTIADRYRVLDVIGRGGSATVYKALDTRRNTVCALKLLDARFADDFVLKERIQQEVKVSLRLKHPNLVRVFDVGEADGQTYLVMEYVERSLAALLVEGKPITADLAIEIVRRVGAALSYVHSQGLVHRDIKPSNILISSDNRVLLSDLGLAIVATQPSLTERGAVLGTPQYMSPEQAQGEPLDARSDIYSLGMVLYEMLTGRVAFTAGSTRDILRQQVHQDPIPLRKLNPAVPAVVEQAVLQALDKDTRRRFQTVEDLMAALTPSRSSMGTHVVGSDHDSEELAALAELIPQSQPAVADSRDITGATIPFTRDPIASTHMLQGAPSALAWLLVLNGPQRGKQLRIADNASIGRAASCDVMLDDFTVSRQHARIRLRDGHFHVVDMSSSNGTLVNGVRVTAKQLRDRDEIRIGDTVMLFVQVVDQDDYTADAKRRLHEFDAAWDQLTKAAHND